MLHTAFDPASGRCSVEFRLPPEVNADRAWLAGEFNDWSTTATPLALHDDGSLAVTLLLEPGRSYRFRYYVGDGRWENDWAAHAYVDNHHGGADSVVVTPPAPASSPPEPTVRTAPEPEPEPTPAPGPAPERGPERAVGAEAGRAEAAPQPVAGAGGTAAAVPSGRLAGSPWRQLLAMGLLLVGAAALRGRHRAVRRRN